MNGRYGTKAIDPSADTHLSWGTQGHDRDHHTLHKDGSQHHTTANGRTYLVADETGKLKRHQRSQQPLPDRMIEWPHMLETPPAEAFEPIRTFRPIAPTLPIPAIWSGGGAVAAVGKFAKKVSYGLFAGVAVDWLDPTATVDDDTEMRQRDEAVRERWHRR